MLQSVVLLSEIDINYIHITLVTEIVHNMTLFETDDQFIFIFHFRKLKWF